MKFDKSRVYTAVNADELQIGSKCLFADTLEELKDLVQECNGYSKTELREIRGGDEIFRFVDKIGHTSSLAYLLLPSDVPKYKPFESVEKAMEVIIKHGGWVKDEGTGCTFLVLGYGEHKEDFSIYIGSEWVPLEDLFMDFIFADDGSPCGELEGA